MAKNTVNNSLNSKNLISMISNVDTIIQNTVDTQHPDNYENGGKGKKLNYENGGRNLKGKL